MGRSAIAASGIAIKYLQAGDMNNVADPVDELRITIYKVAKIILKLASKYFTVIQKVYEDKEQENGMNVMGATAMQENATVMPQQNNITPVHSFDNVKIEIMPGTVWNDMQAADDLKDLRINARVDIPDKYLLEAYSFGNTADIIDDMEADKEKESLQNPDIKLADAENVKLLNGQEVGVNPSDDDGIHLPIHQTILQNLSQQSPVYPVVLKHVQTHIQKQKQNQQKLMQQSGTMPTAPTNPLQNPPK
jgi:hypothetical protein